ncbi:MAG: type II toxin-antitoxin system RelE/ParE family toxin [Candidatus Obscuribacterales bacterium]
MQHKPKHQTQAPDGKCDTTIRFPAREAGLVVLAKKSQGHYHARMGMIKPIRWAGSTLEDLRRLPRQVRRDVGYALGAAQRGERALNVKPLKGFGGASVLEVVENHDGDTYRAVYTVKLKDAVYVLHVFKKKSKRGIATPKAEMEVIRKRLQWVVGQKDK